MKHIDISKPIKRKQGWILATWIVTITGNSFGDQVMTLKKLNTRIKVNELNVVRYQDIMIDINIEGEHQNDEQIIDRFKTWIKNQPKLK